MNDDDLYSLLLHARFLKPVMDGITKISLYYIVATVYGFIYIFPWPPLSLIIM